MTNQPQPEPEAEKGPSPELQAAVARDLDKRRGEFVQVQTGQAVHGAPDPKIRMCPCCELVVELNDSWECPTPGCTRWDGKPIQVFRTYIRIDCEGCGRKRGALLVFNEVKPLPCECEKTLAQKRREELEEQRKALEKAKRSQQLADATKSRACWIEMGRRCELEQPPFAYCHTCTRFGGHYQGLLRKHEREAK